MEVARPLEVPMPKFYTAEGRKALVLRKGFSSPTRDDVFTALGAWAIKTSKPFKLDNSRMKRSRTKQRDIWATCYDKNCKFRIHFQLGEGRDDSMLVDGSMAAGAIAPEWTIVDDVIAHSCGLGFDSEVVKKAKFGPFPRKVLAMALLERLSLETPSKKLGAEQHAVTLKEFLGYMPSLAFVGKVKQEAKKIFYTSHQVPLGSVSNGDFECCGMVRLGQLVEALRECGHRVDITTQKGAKLRSIAIANARSQHQREQEKRPKGNRTAFNENAVRASKFYLSIDDKQDYLHSLLFAPSSSMQQFPSLRRVSYSDMAHVSSCAGGVIYARLALDVDHKQVPLVVGYFADNENQRCHALANKFTADAYKTFDERGQVDVTDGHKGGRAAGLDCFQHVQSFLCNNHTAKNMLQKHGKKGKALLMQAQWATSMEQLGFVKKSMTPAMRQYVERVGTDEMQFQVAASKQGVMLYGNITTNVAESFNKDAKALRAAASEFAIVEGLVHLCFSRFEKAKDNYKKYCTPTGKRTTGSPLTPYIERSISTLERKGYGYVVKALSSNTFSVKSYSEGATTNIVNLNNTDSSWNAKLHAPGGVDFAKLCCGKCAMTHFPCAKVICALGQLDETAGIRSTVKSWLDLGDTLSQWSKQWQPFLQGHAAFQLPQRLNDVPVPMLSQGVKLEQASLTNTTIASPPLLPMPACRPKGTVTTGLTIWGQRKPKRIKTEAGCPGRSGLPRVRSFVYEAQVGLLCAKHAINNLFAIKDFVTLDLLDNNIVPTAKPQGRKDGYSVSTVEECLMNEKGVTLRNLLPGSAKQPMPRTANEWRERSLPIGLILHQECAPHRVGHFVALKSIAREEGVFWRYIDSNTDSYQDFKTPDELAKHMNSLTHITAGLQILGAPNVGEHPDTTVLLVQD